MLEMPVRQHRWSCVTCWSGYEWLVMWLAFLVLFLLCFFWLPGAILLDVVLPAAKARRVGRRVIGWGFRLYTDFLQIFCSCQFDLTDLDTLPAGESRVFVANHPSLLDAPLILSRLDNTACVMKASLMNNGLLGAAARLAGYIRNDKPLRMLLTMRRALTMGSVLIFPEGTRTRRFPMDACGSAALLVARQAGVPVQTLLVSFDYPYLGKAWPLFRPPQLPLRARVSVGRQFSVAELDGMTATDLETYFSEALMQDGMHE